MTFHIIKLMHILECPVITHTHNTRNIFCISKHHHDDGDMTGKTIKVIFPQNYIAEFKPSRSHGYTKCIHGEKS